MISLVIDQQKNLLVRKVIHECSIEGADFAFGSPQTPDAGPLRWPISKSFLVHCRMVAEFHVAFAIGPIERAVLASSVPLMSLKRASRLKDRTFGAKTPPRCLTNFLSVDPATLEHSAGLSMRKNSPQVLRIHSHGFADVDERKERVGVIVKNPACRIGEERVWFVGS